MWTACSSQSVRPRRVLLFQEAVAVENGYYLAGEDTKTSLPGVFAAGDGRKKQVRQLTTAVSDGAAAALAACRYLEEQGQSE